MSIYRVYVHFYLWYRLLFEYLHLNYKCPYLWSRPIKRRNVYLLSTYEILHTNTLAYNKLIMIFTIHLYICGIFLSVLFSLGVCMHVCSVRCMRVCVSVFNAKSSGRKLYQMNEEERVN